MRSGNLPELESQHARVPTFDGAALDVYFHADFGANTGVPIVLVAHGMEGSPRSPSVRRLRLGANARGWNSVALVHRTCGRGVNESKRLYHSAETEDLASVVRWIVERWPGSPLFLAGYSLSGSQLIHFLGNGRHVVPREVQAAACISPPFDLTVSAPEIDSVFGGVYRRYFLRRLIPKALAHARRNPGTLDEAKVSKIRSLRDFDEAVTAVLHGFRDADDYYERGSCARHLPQVSRPLLVVASEDDPFNPGHTIPRAACAENPLVQGLFTRHGGHCGFVAGSVRRPSYWAEAQVLSFFESCRA